MSQKNASAYMLLAGQCLRDARSLYDSGSYRSAAGRAYYAYFDAIRALLISEGVSTKSHSAIKMMFGEHFVKNGPFDRQDAKSFHELFLSRQNSDYEVDEYISEGDMIGAVETVSEVLLQTESYLRENGFGLSNQS